MLRGNILDFLNVAYYISGVFCEFAVESDLNSDQKGVSQKGNSGLYSDVHPGYDILVGDRTLRVQSKLSLSSF